MATQHNASEQATKYLALPEGKIGYDVQGTGPLLVLVPGMGELRSSYRFLTPALVAAGYKVANADLRGHGDSDTTFSSYGDIETAGDVSALIEKLGGPAVIIGNSLAAGSAVIAAADHPKQVSGLVLVGPYVRNPKMSAVQLAVFRAVMAPVWVATSWKYYMPSLYAGQKPVDFGMYRTSVIANIRRPGYAKAFSLTAKQTDHAPAEARLAAVAAPVLVIMGERDPDFKDPTAEARWIGETLQGEVVMVPDAGHYPQSQQPALVATAVLKFLADVTTHA
jgi:pimeloyl-ACP methyl ester carboxylesterase